MSALAMSGDLTEAPLLDNRLFYVEQWDGEKWMDLGNLALFSNTAFLNQEKLYHVHFQKPTNSVAYSFGKDGSHRSGRLFFTEDQTAFTGSICDATGTIRAVRGGLESTTFDTQRKVQKGPDSSWTPWLPFKFGTDWDDNEKRLKSEYHLGDQDITARTALTNVQQWNSTIEMQKSLDPLGGGGQDTFSIVVKFPGHTFTGTYTAEDGTLYDWKGTAQAASRSANTANPAAFAHIDGKALTRVIPTAQFSADARAAEVNGPSLEVGDLMNVSSITEVKVGDKTLTVDSAQIQTGKYFQEILMNALDDKWVTDFFGSRKPLPPGVQKVMDDNIDFYKQKAVMNLGQMIHDSFGTDQAHRDIIKKIDNDKLSDAWKSLGTDKGYASQSSPLYIQGYKDGVPGIQPYLQTNPEDWAKQLFDTITSEDFLSMWVIQVASASFKNVKQQMYEWYVQLSVLAPDKSYAQEMLNTTFAVVIRAQYNSMQWAEDLKPFLKQAINNLLSGSADFATDQSLRRATALSAPADELKTNAEGVKALIQGMVSTFGTVDILGDEISNLMTFWANRNQGRAMLNAAGEVAPLLGAGRAVPLGWKTIGGKVLGSIVFAAGAGFLLSQIAPQNLNPIADINLALLATGFIVKSIEKLLATGIGAWLETKNLSEFASRLTGWFTEKGVEAESWALRIFGKSSAEFFAKRLGPVLALFGIVISAAELIKAIKSGDVRDAIFESINTFFALAGAVLIGLELMSVGWAGPVGLAVAVVGAIVALVQLIWNLISPPSPPPDPVQQFVVGPLKSAGFVTV